MEFNRFSRLRGRKLKRTNTYFCGVEPDQVERVEVERGIGAVEDGPSAELGGGEAGDYDARELGGVAGELTGAGDGGLEDEKDQEESGG